MAKEDVRIVMWPDTPDGKWRLFRNPVGILTANRPDEVLPVLHAAEEAVHGRNLHAAGFLAYEAAPGLDTACRTHDLKTLPLAWFGLFKEPEEIDVREDPAESPFHTGEWKPSMSHDRYVPAIARIKDYLSAGDTYQVNYTIRLRTSFDGNPFGLFRRLRRSQKSRYCAFLETDAFAICSASPELFFRLDAHTLTSRPMKGTSDRGLTSAQDTQMAAALHASEKNRAENVMIVDMVRNDMGRVADKGSVRVPNLFEIEKYPTLYQMTSTVASDTSASFAEIMKALFPCASITGAPKIRTMEIIRELEPNPRGIYTGCIGVLAPGRHAEFNVAIRTVWLDKTRKSAEYGVGGGIVWDSDADNEYEECRVKTAVLTADTPDFDLIETMLWEPESGYFLLGLHLERLRQSAEYFGFRIDLPSVRARAMLEADARRNAAGGATPARVRLLLSESGEVNMDWGSLPSGPRNHPWQVALARNPVDRRDRFLYHKTTRRQTYDRAKQDHPRCDDVLLWNDAGEVTESTIANIVVETAGKRITPPVECGLLAGVFRQWLLDHGEIEEGILKVEDLRKADRIFLVNSVRKWMDVELV